MKMSKETDTLAGCASAVYMTCLFIMAVVNLWLTWRICRAVEAILAK